MDDVGSSGIMVDIQLAAPGAKSDSSKPMVDASRRPGYITLEELNLTTLPDKSYSFKVIPDGTFFDFATIGARLNGSIIRDGTEDPIFDGKISRNKITFTLKEIIEGKTYSYSYAGELTDGVIRFEVKPPANGGDRFRFTVKRLRKL